jgi:hypothetical protein
LGFFGFWIQAVNLAYCPPVNSTGILSGVYLFLEDLASPAIEFLEQGEWQEVCDLGKTLSPRSNILTAAIKHRLYYENPVLYVVSGFFHVSSKKFCFVALLLFDGSAQFAEFSLLILATLFSLHIVTGSRVTREQGEIPKKKRKEAHKKGEV